MNNKIKFSLYWALAVIGLFSCSTMEEYMERLCTGQKIETGLEVAH